MTDGREARDQPLVPQLVSEDASFQPEQDLPTGLTRAGDVVYWEDSPSFNRVAVLLDPEVEVKPGQFLGVWHGRRDPHVLTIVQVADSLEVNPNEAPQLAAARERLGLGRGYAGEGVSTRIYRLADCATIEEFRIDPSTLRVLGEAAALENLPRSGDPAVLLPDSLVAAIVGSATTPDSGVHVGDLYGAVSLPVVLPPQIFQMHIGNFGNPGKGKSYLAGNLLEEAYAWNIPALVLDINGETIPPARTLGGLVITLPDPVQFGLSLSLITPPELVSITPNVQPNTIYAELIELAHDQLRAESRGNPISFDQLYQRISDLGTQTNAPRTSIGAAISRLHVLARDPLMGGTFDFISTLIKHRVVVLDCRFLSLRQTQLIAAAAARELQKAGRDHARAAEAGDERAKDWFALYFVDEAHAVAPDDDEVVSSQVLFELARMGRHVRTGLVLSSQSPTDLSSSVLKRLQTRFVFALEKDQLRAIQGVTADLDEKVIKQLPKLPRGVCAVSGSSELVKHGFILEVRSRRTPVGGSTPGVFDQRTKRNI